jgi:ergothioneine biosynthesis protein EgtB
MSTIARPPIRASLRLDRADLQAAYADVRATTERLCAPLATEDYVLQAMPDVSPTRWHLAHVTWFFETFVLARHAREYRSPDPAYRYLFNSYYNTVGPQFERPRRGHLSRPTVAEIYRYRSGVDAAMARLLDAVDPADVTDALTLGLHHEQQHQELILTDIKFNLGVNPLRPAYHDVAIPCGTTTPPMEWDVHAGGLVTIGHDGVGFAFDNEGPQHEVYLQPFALGTRLVTNGEYLEFMADGGYTQWSLWLSEGFRVAQERGWRAPLYWEERDGAWWTHTLSGPMPVDPHAPVTHVSYYEADAYARWRSTRLPTEQEWEHGARDVTLEGNLQDRGIFHPLPAHDASQLIGDVWEWTASPYVAYPGFRAVPGALGEYNGKFMVNQMVLRGGSCVTPRSHVRATYRNFFPPDARWQFSGIRLALDV